MTYKDNIENANLFGSTTFQGDPIPGYGNGKAFQKMRKQVFFAKAYRTHPGQADRPFPKEKIWTIKEAMEKWGVGHLYNDLIESMVLRTKNHPDEIAIVEWYGTDLTKNPDEQRMLEWGLYDTETGKSYISGGVMFQHGKMSFHT